MSSYVFDTRAELDKAVSAWINNETQATSTYGDINTWDVSGIKDFSSLFRGQTNFNSDISNWDVSNGTNFMGMFSNGNSDGESYENQMIFNQDISDWDVSRGIHFASMFYNASSFNQDISSWDVSSGKTFGATFQNATAFNQNIGIWNVSSATNFDSMFRRATSFNQDIGNWDVSSIKTFEWCFTEATTFNQDISKWDVASSRSFEGMFGGASSFNQDISTWVIGSEADIEIMFYGATSMIEGQGVSGTPDRSYFVGPVSITLDVSGHQIGTNYQLEYIKDYDGNLHANTDNLSDATKSAYKYQGLIDVNADGTKEAVYTNKESGRWVTGSINSSGEIDYSEHGKGGTTRIVGIYIDPLVTSGEVEQFGPHDSQRRFQNDLLIDNLAVKTAGDYDNDGFQEVYWKTNDGTAYLRALMHADGNIQYANYQSEAQMREYLTSNGDESVISDIV